MHVSFALLNMILFYFWPFFLFNYVCYLCFCHKSVAVSFFCSLLCTVFFFPGISLCPMLTATALPSPYSPISPAPPPPPNPPILVPPNPPCKVNSGSGCTVDIKRPRWKHMVSPLESRWVCMVEMILVWSWVRAWPFFTVDFDGCFLFLHWNLVGRN